MRKGIIKKMSLSLTLVLILAFFVLVSSENMVYAKETSKGSNQWMKELDDEISISQITIPGTHDSGTQYVPLGYAMRCQNTSIKNQLKAGYRYLDIRVAVEDTADGPKLIIVHNFAKCHVGPEAFSGYLTFSDVCNDIKSFLDSNQSETVIMNIKIEDNEHSISQVQKLIHKEISSANNLWYTENRIPTLGEVRGKIVLATRFEDEAGYAETGIQMLWAEQSDTKVVDIPYELYVEDGMRLWVQDRYNYSVADKYDAVVDGIENCEADENTIFLNFVSTSGKGSVGHPKGYAKQLNSMLMRYDLKSDTSYGILIVDFGSEKLAKHIYNSNF